jgi:hypothetical protein
MKKTIATLIVVAALAVGQAPAQKNWKDRAEYDLYAEIVKPDATPAARLANLDKWKSGYAQSEYAPERTKIYLITYQQLQKHREAFDTAAEILKSDPNDQASVQEILGFIRALMPTQANAALSAQNKADLDLAEKVARGLLANPDALYGADKKPQGVADDAWAKTKPTMMNFAQFTLGYIAVTQKDLAKAETELTKTLQSDGSNAQASYMLAGILLGQQKDHPEKMPLAMFEYARAATYDGPGSMDANTRKQIDAFLSKAYNTYHGSAQGLDAIKTQAKANALPVGGFAIKSVVDIAKEDEEKRAQAAKDNPVLAFWNDVKENLTGDGSAAYWEAMKGAGLPPPGKLPGDKLKGKLVSATPETRPKELTLAIGGGAADVTLKLDEPLPGKMDPGGEISFFGEAKEFNKDPFTVTFEVVPTDIEGWTGKGPAPAARPGAGKKGAPATKKQ